MRKASGAWPASHPLEKALTAVGAETAVIRRLSANLRCPSVPELGDPVLWAFRVVKLNEGPKFRGPPVAFNDTNELETEAAHTGPS